MGRGNSGLTPTLRSGNASDRREGREGRFTRFGDDKWEALNKSTNFFHRNSNSDDWNNGLLTGSEYDAIRHYTGSGYSEMNHALYTTKFEDMNPHTRNLVEKASAGISKFQLDKGIEVTRQSDFRIFGAKAGEQMTVQQIKDYILKYQDPKDGTLQNDGFLSFGANNKGAAIDGSGLVIHAKVPPSIGAGAYVNPISSHKGAGENEFLFNSMSRFKFDLSSIRVVTNEYGGKTIHIDCIWKGRGKKQSLRTAKKNKY